MVKLATGLLVGIAAVPSHAQSIEGFWQDTERRILFSADAPPGYVYGRWTALAQDQTYPSAKQILKSSKGVEVVDLLYDTDEVVRVGRADQKSIEFTRANTWSKCSVVHRCDLQSANQMLCALERSCPVAGKQQVVWRGEERYARREFCERVDKRQAQGIPHRCR